ncbi:zinc-dependent alcohol dehydrogenase family protein [Amycolatopsis sp. NPDC049868]|uniref:zinc-dependent alcohol dehydrogenase family protein n=1 Tax=Amycolatopsis sp. NPDC049868 TaxID=3363934 RepID=UPI0037A0E4B5
MRAVTYRAPREFLVSNEREVPLRSGELRLRVLASGLCGTDLHIHEGGFGAKFPITPGHEIIGEVIEKGAESGALAVGSRVAVDNVMPCGHCSQCQDGRSELCAHLSALGLTHPGGAAEYVIASAEKCVSIGDLDLNTAILAEPTACVVHGLDVLQLKPASDVLVIGAGPTGQILSQLLVRGGASRVTVAAPTQFKLDVAKRNGASMTLRTQRSDFGASVPELRDVSPDGFDVVIDATGEGSVLRHCVSLVRGGGTLMVYGMSDENVRIDINPYEIFRRELTIKGSFAQTNCVARAVRLLQGGGVVSDGIVTHRFGLDCYGEALAALRSRSCLKAVIVPEMLASDTSDGELR